MWIDRRVLMIAGAASLALNVFLVGIVAGRVFLHEPQAKHSPASTAIIASGKVKALTPEDRRVFNAAMAAHRQQVKATREAQREARAAVLRDIAAPTYDSAKVRNDFAALRQAHDATRAALDDALTEALGALSPDARASLVERAP